MTHRAVLYIPFCSNKAVSSPFYISRKWSIHIGAMTPFCDRHHRPLRFTFIQMHMMRCIGHSLAGGHILLYSLSRPLHPYINNNIIGFVTRRGQYLLLFHLISGRCPPWGRMQCTLLNDSRILWFSSSGDFIIVRRTIKDFVNIVSHYLCYSKL